jgi:hypothetical protein
VRLRAVGQFFRRREGNDPRIRLFSLTPELPKALLSENRELATGMGFKKKQQFDKPSGSESKEVK